MSVEINYQGRIGNVIFQYVFGRLLAVKNGLHLETEFPFQAVLRTTESEEGRVFTGPVRYIRNNIEGYDKSSLMNGSLPAGKYILEGYFERSEFYNPHVELIKGFFALDPVESNADDIVVNLRLGDFCRSRLIHPEWYLGILEREDFDRLYVVGSRPDEPYLEYFANYRPVIVPTDPAGDFHFIRKFDRIICSNSTYCWWAAFLSEASRIYIPDNWISRFLKSCKSSTRVETQALKGYVSRTTYGGVEYLRSRPG